MHRDYELLNKYQFIITSSAFDLLKSCIEQNNGGSETKVIDLVDFDQIQNKVQEMMDYLTANKKFRRLDRLFKGKLDLDHSRQCFIVDGHYFSSLDEVERAYNNRAFL